jgi:hypothetical protein
VPLLDDDSASGLLPRITGRQSGRLAQLTLAVALAPFAVLTVLFVGAEHA